ncbi:MAG: hypothetical protein KKB50_18185 [Planctomycetes bacterium]|nr:hypothetical protein [Planctomycetota bacterium]
MIAAALRILAIMAVALTAATVQVRVSGLPWVPDVATLRKEDRQRHREFYARQHREQIRQEAALTLEEFREFYEALGVVIDTRPTVEFEQEHLDAPRIMNVPADDLESSVELLFELHGYGLPVVFYCESEECGIAVEMYEEMELVGHADMRVFLGGWRALKAAGLPTAGGPQPPWLAEFAAQRQPAKQMTTQPNRIHGGADAPVITTKPADEQES